MKFTQLKAAVLAGATALGMATASNATILTVFDGFVAGKASFNSTVGAAGGTVSTTVLGGLSSGTMVDAGDFVISMNDGGSVPFGSHGTSVGQMIAIDPSSSTPEMGGMRNAPADYFVGGVTFSFKSAVNSVGFEVGDWATCCFDPTTDLFISFDGGTPIQVATADEQDDGRFPNQNFPTSLIDEIFVAAFDDSGSFTDVSFWGNGLGEVLFAGGEIRYALVGGGTLPPTTPSVPLPAAGWMLLAGLGGLGVMRRRASKKA